MEAWNIPCRRRYSAFMMEILSVSLWKLTQELHSSASGLQVRLAPLDLCKAQFIPHLLHADFLSGTHPFSSDFLWLWVPHKPHVLRCIYYYLLTLLQWKAKGTLTTFHKLRFLFVSSLQRRKLDHNLGIKIYCFMENKTSLPELLCTQWA